MNYTEEIYERLTKYRNSLYNACNFDYVRLTSVEEKNELAEIYKEHFKKDSGIIGGCSRCILKDCKALGKLYFEDEKVYKELELKSKDAENEEVVNNEEKNEIKDERTNKRKGRPKKSN